MPLIKQELHVAKLIELESCTTITKGSKLTKDEILNSLKSYKVLYNKTEIFLWVNGVVYKFIIAF